MAGTSRIPDMLLTCKEVADYLSISEESLAQNRFHGDGIPYVKIGSRVRYRLSALMEYIEANSVENRGEPSAPVVPVKQPARISAAKRV